MTRFDVETFPQGDVLGGSFTYIYAQHGPAILEAFSKLARDADPKAATWLAAFPHPQAGLMVSLLSLHLDKKRD